MPIRWATALLVLAFAAMACGSDSAERPSVPDDVATEAAAGEVLTPVALPGAAPSPVGTDIDAAVAADAALAVDLYQEFATGDGNVVFSPLSVSQALHMSLVGAAGDTAVQLREALHMQVPDEVAHASRLALLRELEAEPVRLNDGDDRASYALAVNDALFVQSGYPFLDDYLTSMSTDYEAALLEADFLNRPGESTIAINEWVADTTNDRITDLLNELGSDTRAVLVDTVWFKGFWGEPLEELDDGPFTLADGSEVTTPRWQHTRSARYAEGDGWVRATLPYLGGTSMSFVLPDEGRFAEVEAALGPAVFDPRHDDVVDVDLIVPPFDFSSRPLLGAAMQALGIVDAFEPGLADFSAMTGGRDLYIFDALHEANISLDENGTEAAAATAIVFYEVSGAIDPPQPPEIHLDRPFLFAISHDTTGEILFLGRVMDPTAS